MALRTASLVLTAWAAAAAQSLVEREHIAGARKAFESAATAPQLRCGISGIRPALNFGFRFQTGYTIDVPLSQFRGSGHALNTLVRVTPEGREPSYLTSTESLPAVPETKLDGEVAGTFVVGDGAYGVEALVEDDLHRVCRGKWRIQTKRSGSERDLKPAAPPAAVEELQASSPGSPESKPGPRIERLTVLIHAAPLSPNASKLQPDDVSMLVGSLTSVLEQLPARYLRVVVFNLDQQAVLLRKDGFARADLGDVTTALNQLGLALVDYRALQKRDRSGDLLADLLQTELRAPRPPGAVILLGPRTRPRPISQSDVPVEAPYPHPATAVPLFYVQYRPPRSLLLERGPGPAEARGGGRAGRGYSRTPNDPGGIDPAMTHSIPDRVEQLLGRFKGETIAVWTPRDFADAIRHMAVRIRATAGAAALSEAAVAAPALLNTGGRVVEKGFRAEWLTTAP